MSSALRLDSTFVTTRPGRGIVRLRLVNAGNETLRDFRIAFSSIVHLTPADGAPVELVRRVGTYHELGAPAGIELGPGGVWDIGALECEYQLSHANDGPVRAFVIRADGSIVSVHAVRCERGGRTRMGRSAPPRLALTDATDVTGRAWERSSACEARLHPDSELVLATDGTGNSVEAGIDGGLGAEDFRVEPVEGPGAPSGSWTVRAGSPVALQWALMTLARSLRGDVALDRRDFTPRHRYRGLMIDLARHFHPAADVDELIHHAAWRRLNRLHLHLTDDQGWRVPIAAHPSLALVGAWRGYGLPLLPQNGSGAEPYGGCYTTADIAGWVARAADYGIEVIPEIDVPGHCAAAIAAVPALADPNDASTAQSVHHFPHNVLNPGLDSTRRFLEAVFDEVAGLFPASLLHLGGDEVPDGAWQGSPAAARYAAERSLTTHREIESSFVAEIVAIVTRTTGRRVGVWQEAAEAGAMAPGDALVYAWKSADDARRLAAAGHDVVDAHAEAYYLDMATGHDWHLPGMSWAGVVTPESMLGADTMEGWDRAERERVAGIQACLWGEHLPDRATLRSLLLPRLDTFGDCGWR